jgi:hypothetical protein
MIRSSLGLTALTGAVLWALIPSATAQPPKDPDPPARPGLPGISPQSQKINEFIAKGYEAGGVKQPSARCSDNEFLRRVFIDLIGRIATPEEVIDFERDGSPDKRVKLVRRLLYDEKYQPKNKSGSPFPKPGADPKTEKGALLTFDYSDEYAEHWANLWTVWLMTRSGHPTYRDQMHVWLELQFGKNVPHKDLVAKLLTATGTTGEDRPDRGGNKDANAVNFIVAHLGDPVPQANRQELGAFEAVPITSRVTRLFLGIQTQCTQCHDHPHNKQWLQADFWGVNAFFRQTVRSATPTMAPMGNRKDMPAAAITLSDDPGLNPEMIIYYERRDGRKMGSYPVMLKDLAQANEGQKSTKMLSAPPAGKTRRQQLAEWITGHDNFSRAYVNRIWGHFFGRGMNKDAPADDFGSHNEVVHPDLLNYLAGEFATYGYDSKKLLEWIACSDAYNLSHVAVKEYSANKYDPYFARMPLKAMSPEVLFDSLTTATRTGRNFGIKREERKALREAWERKLVRNFGDDEGNELTFNGTVVQALLMMNGGELNGEIGVGANNKTGKPNPDNVVAEVLKRHSGSPSAIYDELFLLTLNRHPTPHEIGLLEEVRTGKARVDLGGPSQPGPGGKPKPSGGVVVPPSGNDPSFYQDVFWALLNSSEFMLNH